MKMRILVVGAGATGGYFGGRLLQAGRDVTFLVRAKRAAELAASGLNIQSPFGDATLVHPPTITAEKLDRTFDLVLLSCKAYDLDGAIDALTPAVGTESLILPLLNGMQHIDVLDNRFGRPRVLGGLCAIAATLDEQRKIVHLNDLHSLTFGCRDESQSDRIPQLTETMTNAGFNSRHGDDIMYDMWEKWVFLATLAGATCLMRASVGQILMAPGGRDLVLGLFSECSTIAKAQGFPPRQRFLERGAAMLADEGSTLTASMLRDVESGFRIEADHVIGDLLRRQGIESVHNLSSNLRVAFAHLKAYEIRREATQQKSETR
jgi:2-dehydropantoate 2-reductase